ncbi:MAG: bifunctional riboflavin kinase/FAD synthetase [Candidatus Omnitrophica bacterium]|nr:bifunctional riboflavin kinase/FAD synthetase [Candidatus Omnitrophota bacterium]MDD5236915.1 bifunctional riboflavin kinase/FAD synthetase [Candidatus Omnitrophota bacterium]MDD5610019.1 bifunctional riboflavin kinase/FAD synthetase [Candidatus Omnitrophota bacterium]
MKVISSPGKIKHRFNRPAVAIGIFDGLHRGHIFVIKKLVKFARQAKARSIVVTFHPHPAKEKSLLSLRHRIKLIKGLGVDICAVIGFTKKFSEIAPQDFIRNVLVKKFNPQAVFVGENFTFGKNASGNVKFLESISAKYDFNLFSIPVVKSNNRIISSTYIRALIRRGRIAAAHRLLGRPVAVLGTVVKGSGLGRLWNVPTANIDPHHEVLPADGVYAVKVKLGDKLLNGVCYIGKVSVVKKRPYHIEVYIFNFHKRIYGKDLEILFVKKMRDARRYAEKEQLIRQIKKDIGKAKKAVK